MPFFLPGSLAFYIRSNLACVRVSLIIVMSTGRRRIINAYLNGKVSPSWPRHCTCLVCTPCLGSGTELATKDISKSLGNLGDQLFFTRSSSVCSSSAPRTTGKLFLLDRWGTFLFLRFFLFFCCLLGSMGSFSSSFSCWGWHSDQAPTWRYGTKGAVKGSGGLNAVEDACWLIAGWVMTSESGSKIEAWLLLLSLQRAGEKQARCSSMTLWSPWWHSNWRRCLPTHSWHSTGLQLLQDPWQRGQWPKQTMEEWGRRSDRQNLSGITLPFWLLLHHTSRLLWP